MNQNGLQSTFSLTAIEAAAAISILNTGKALETSNMLAEEIFFGIWENPNFHTKDTNEEIKTWPVTGYNCTSKTGRAVVQHCSSLETLRAALGGISISFLTNPRRRPHWWPVPGSEGRVGL